MPTALTKIAIPVAVISGDDMFGCLTERYKIDIDDKPIKIKDAPAIKKDILFLSSSDACLMKTIPKFIGAIAKIRMADSLGMEKKYFYIKLIGIIRIKDQTPNLIKKLFIILF